MRHIQSWNAPKCEEKEREKEINKCKAEFDRLIISNYLSTDVILKIYLYTVILI